MMDRETEIKLNSLLRDIYNKSSKLKSTYTFNQYKEVYKGWTIATWWRDFKGKKSCNSKKKE